MIILDWLDNLFCKIYYGRPRTRVIFDGHVAGPVWIGETAKLEGPMHITVTVDATTVEDPTIHEDDFGYMIRGDVEVSIDTDIEPKKVIGIKK